MNVSPIALALIATFEYDTLAKLFPCALATPQTAIAAMTAKSFSLFIMLCDFSTHRKTLWVLFQSMVCCKLSFLFVFEISDNGFKLLIISLIHSSFAAIRKRLYSLSLFNEVLFAYIFVVVKIQIDERIEAFVIARMIVWHFNKPTCEGLLNFL